VSQFREPGYSARLANSFGWRISERGRNRSC